MPIRLDESEEGALAIINGSGIVVDDEFISVHEELFLTPEKIGRLRRILSEWSDVEKMLVTNAAIRHVANLAVSVFDGSDFHRAVAIVAPRDVLFGLARMWNTLSDEAKLEQKIFRNRDDAIEWLQK